MWLLPTRGRPKLCQQCLDACELTGMSSPGLIIIDETTEGQYSALRVPKNWNVHFWHMDMANTMRYTLEAYPNEGSYGWIADDLIPKTLQWDKKLEELAGDWYLADSNDMWLSSDPAIRWYRLGSAFCWGGDLVRSVGWWALPGVRQAGIDDAWVDICCKRLLIRRYAKDVIIDHKHYKNDKRPYDLTDSHVRDGLDYIAEDFKVLEQWRYLGGDVMAVERIVTAMRAKGVAP